MKKNYDYHNEINTTVDKKIIKSEIQSTDKITPSNKFFFSKCDSPKEPHNGYHSPKEFCNMHSMD